MKHGQYGPAVKLLAFVFKARPVVPDLDAVRVELEALPFRDELKGRYQHHTGRLQDRERSTARSTPTKRPNEIAAKCRLLALNRCP